MRFVVFISAVALGHIAAAVASTQADRWPADLWERLGRELLCLPVPIDAQYVCIVLLPSAQKWSCRSRHSQQIGCAAERARPRGAYQCEGTP